MRTSEPARWTTRRRRATQPIRGRAPGSPFQARTGPRRRCGVPCVGRRPGPCRRWRACRTSRDRRRRRRGPRSCRDSSGPRWPSESPPGSSSSRCVMIQLHWLHQVGLEHAPDQPACRVDGPRGGDPGDPRPDAGLVAPALAWSAWRERPAGASRPLSWTWSWAGMVLGTLLFLGPLLAVRGLHGAAALALAVGAGIPHPSLRRAAHAGLAARLVLARGDRAGRAHRSTHSGSGTGSPAPRSGPGPGPRLGPRTCSGSSWTPSAPTT